MIKRENFREEHIRELQSISHKDPQLIESILRSQFVTSKEELLVYFPSSFAVGTNSSNKT